MRRLFYLLTATIAIAVLASCAAGSEKHPYAGTFVTDDGVRFELKEDSTTLIRFNDSLTYEGKWKVTLGRDDWEYANIEFAGNTNYYYLKDGKLYRSEREMRHDKLGQKVKYEK